MNPVRAPRLVAWLVILAGVSAAMHVGKLPPGMAALQEELGISLVQAGFLLSLVQLGSIGLGLAAGLLADSVGLRRTMVVGLLLLGFASAAGAWAQGIGSLLLLRALESMGFLMTVVPAPSLLRRTVGAAASTRALGVWGAYFPLGTAAALLLGPFVIGGTGWRSWWVGVGLVSLVVAACMLWRVPPDPRQRGPKRAAGGLWREHLALALHSWGPWLAALSFCVYSAQWLAVIGFLPVLYQQLGWGGALVAALTALVALANVSGNIAAGRLLHRNAAPVLVLGAGFAGMALGAWLAYTPLTEQHLVLRYMGALVFSAVGGLIPGALFALAPRLAPSEGTMATTVGWMQQWSALGQFSGPPAVAWLASRLGGWQWTWVATGLCCVAGVLLALRIAVELRSTAPA